MISNHCLFLVNKSPSPTHPFLPSLGTLSLFNLIKFFCSPRNCVIMWQTILLIDSLLQTRTIFLCVAPACFTKLLSSFHLHFNSQLDSLAVSTQGPQRYLR